MMMVWPVVYPPRPPKDDEVIFQAVLPLFQARSWAENAARARERASKEKNKIERVRLEKMADWADNEVFHLTEKFVAKLANLPSPLRAEADAICRRPSKS